MASSCRARSRRSSRLTRLRGKNKPTFKKLSQGGNDTLKVFKEFYIPTESHSIYFLKTTLCVACTKGFEIVDLETLPADASLDLVKCQEAFAR
ncbi:RHO1 GDP-GTP exchange protein 2 [Ceratobasidium sp. 395]|nr:RHO1 GDP-GTP exchange protein 2 [Ceratobasidium sp. 395]